MAFTLGDVENDCLSLLASNNPPPNYGAGGASTYPQWAGAQGTPRFSQGLVDAAINRSLQKLISSFADLEILDYSVTFPTTAQVYAYPMPPNSVAQGTLAITGTPTTFGTLITLTIGSTMIEYTTNSTDTSAAQVMAHLIIAINASAAVSSGTIVPVSPKGNAANTIIITATSSGTAGNSIALAATSSNAGQINVTASGASLAGGTATNPNVQQIRRVFYQPQGMNYRRDNAAGDRLVSWNDFNMYTGSGYLLPFSFATEPDYISLSPNRKDLVFFPGPANNGDLVTVQYVPTATMGTGQPVLIEQTDVVPLPDDFRDALTMGAMFWLWPVASQFGLRKSSLTEFREEIMRLRSDWAKGSAGESQRIVDAAEARMGSAWARL